MSRIQVAFYREADGEAPVVNWLRELMKANAKGWAHCRARIELLAQFGQELRRPAADYLRTGFMNCERNKAMSNIESSIFFTSARLPYLHIA